MPWKNVTPMEEIIRFVILAQSARFTVSELCEQFGISRKTGYKHLERYAASGLKGLVGRSHRPHQFPQRTEAAVEALILAERRLHRTWGPKKLHKVLEVKHGLESPPARSTIGEAGYAEFFTHRTGHGIGLEVHEDPYIVAGNSTPLRPGMSFSVEPGIYLPGRWGVRLENIVICTGTGADVLNMSSLDLRVVRG